MKKLFGLFLSVTLTVCLFTESVYAASGDPLLEPLDLAAEVGSSVLPVANGGTGAATLTDGGVLLGSGTGAVTPMAVLADGEIIIGDGTTDPVPLAAFTSSTGVLKIAYGGTNSTTALGNDKVMVSSAGAIIESATITTAELALLNGIASVSTGTGDNDKFVTQGYVDDHVAAGGGALGAAATVGITGGITATMGASKYGIIQAETGTADDLDEITSSASVGDIVVIQADAGDTITVKDGTYLNLQADFIMNAVTDKLTLLCTTAGANDTFTELSRASND